MSREKRYWGNAGMCEKIAYGNGMLYGSSFSTGKLAEFDLRVADQIKLVGTSDVLPSPPTALCINNIGIACGARSRYFDSEFLRGPEIAHFLETDIDFDRDITTAETQAEVARLPFDIDYSHYGIEYDFFYVSPYNGTVQLTFQSDDGLRVWIDGELAIQKWLTQGPATPGDPIFTAELDLEIGQRVRIKIEYADAKAIAGLLSLLASPNDGVYTKVPCEDLIAVARTGTRVDDDDLVGTEVSPDGGGLYAVAKGYLYSYPGGVLNPHTHIAAPAVGKTIINTSWHYILYPIENAGVQLRNPFDINTVVVERKVPFDIDLLIPYSDNLVFGIHRDGRYMILEVTNDIEVRFTGQFQNCVNPVGGYVDYTALETDRLFLASEDYGIREFNIALDDRLYFTTDLGNQSEFRTIQDVQTYYTTNQFVSTLDPDDDVQLSLQMPRTGSTNSRWGITVATGDTGNIAISKQDVPTPTGIQVPLIPNFDVRYALRDQGGQTSFVDNEGTSTGTTVVPIDGLTQLITPASIPRRSLPGDEIDFVLDSPLTSPCGIYIEFAASRTDDVASNVATNIILLGNPEFLKIHIHLGHDPHEYVAIINGSNLMNQVGSYTLPYANMPPLGEYNDRYRQVFINIKADLVDIWIGGVRVFTYNITVPSVIDTSVFRIFDTIANHVNEQQLSLSDMRVYNGQAITDDQARIFSGGLLEVIP